MLNTYLTQTARLLQNPGAPTSLYSTSDLTYYINVARGQIAGEGRCVRSFGTATANINQTAKVFSAFVPQGTAGGIINVRALSYASGPFNIQITPVPWEYFTQYYISDTTAIPGPAQFWAQFPQGASSGTSPSSPPPNVISGGGLQYGGGVYWYPPADQTYTIVCEAVWYPVALVADADFEPIPYLWTDAVPYYAAYLALMSSQTSTRLDQAQRLYQLYETFMQRARAAVTPDILPLQYNQTPNPARVADLGQGAKSASVQ